MNDAHAYEMQVQMWKSNIWGVTLSFHAVPISLTIFYKIFLICLFDVFAWPHV
jgi:hypothetical protein